jgi:hypothetical protein
LRRDYYGLTGSTRTSETCAAYHGLTGLSETLGARPDPNGLSGSLGISGELFVSLFLFFHVFIFPQIFFLYLNIVYTNTSSQRHLRSSDIPFKMRENDQYCIPLLSRDNNESWFQDMRFKLHGQEIFYVVETTMREYAWIECDNSTTTPRTKDNK